MQKFCEKCGNKLIEGGDVCLKCGNVFNPVKVQKNKVTFMNNCMTPIIIVCVAVVFPFILLFGIWFVQDINNEIECRRRFGNEYRLEREHNIDDGLCCLKGQYGNNCKSLHN